jgi:hypothetical protein
MILVLLESDFCALFNGTLDKIIACSQQKLQAEQYAYNFYRHAHGLDIINPHIHSTNSHFSIKHGHLSIDCIVQCATTD